MGEPSLRKRLCSSRGEATELLDEIPGAYERGQLGLAQIEAGETIPVDDL